MSNLMRKIVYKTKLILLNKKEPSYYVKKFKKNLEKDEKEKAFNSLKRGNSFYPNNKNIHLELATYYYNEKKWSKAIEHYEFLMKAKGEKYKKANIYMNCGQAYIKSKKINKSIEVLEAGLQMNPGHVKLQLKVIELYVMVNKPHKAVKYVLDYLNENENNLKSEELLLFSKVYRSAKEYEKADYILQKAIKTFSNDVELWKGYIEVAIDRFEWFLALERIDRTVNLNDLTKELKFELEMKKAMIYQILGKVEQATDLYKFIFNTYQDLIEKDKKGNRKIILFDNGESRIEFYKKLESVTQIIVSFDSLHMDWHEPAFGYVLLKKQPLDIIAVRKKRKSTYQQDLKQEDFINTVAPIAEQYNDRIAYGHSLGGYLSLYYASNIKGCRILSLAPRLSIHPVYGRRTKYDKDLFLHKETNNFNSDIKPIIVYDPRDKVDGSYVNDELLLKFPNAILIKMPYGGHGIARHLLRMGELKNFILTVIKGDLPQYNRKLKHKSGNYCRLLARKCLNNNKLQWADYLSEKALELLPSDKYAVKTRVDILLKLERFEEAKETAFKSARKAPKSLYKQMILIDFYLQTNNLMQAEFELKRVETFHGMTAEIEKRKTTLNQKFKSLTQLTVMV